MAGELTANSSGRGGATVWWLALHTAEGGYDSDPADHGIDAGSARSLVAFFQRSSAASSHAIADDDVLLDNLVPYDRKAWTLRGGNPYSDNLEQIKQNTGLTARAFLQSVIGQSGNSSLIRQATAYRNLNLSIGVKR